MKEIINVIYCLYLQKKLETVRKIIEFLDAQLPRFYKNNWFNKVRDYFIESEYKLRDISSWKLYKLLSMDYSPNGVLANYVDEFKTALGSTFKRKINE